MSNCFKHVRKLTQGLNTRPFSDFQFHYLKLYDLFIDTEKQTRGLIHGDNDVLIVHPLRMLMTGSPGVGLRHVYRTLFTLQGCICQDISDDPSESFFAVRFFDEI